MLHKFVSKEIFYIIICSFIINFAFGQNLDKTAKNAIIIDSIKSKKAISLVLNYVNLIERKDIDSIIELSDIHYKRIVKWSSKPEKVEILKSLPEVRNSFELTFSNDINPILFVLDTIYISLINKKIKRRRKKSDEIYFVTMISKDAGNPTISQQKYKSIFAVRMIDSPKIFGLLEE